MVISCGGVLLEIERRIINIRAGAVAVDVELHQPVLRRRAYHQGDLHLLPVGVVRGKFYLARHLLVVLVGVGHGLPRAEAASCVVTRSPLPLLMQLTTAAERSVTLLTFMVISIVSPVDFTSVAKGL